MVSYQLANQQVFKEIRDRIKQHGYKVWMDIDETGGSPLQAMAEAVENTELVLLCMSAKYSHSPNCRADAEYVFHKGKRIIPLKMEQGYVPDGWLGFICGAKLFYDLSDNARPCIKTLNRAIAQTLMEDINKKRSTHVSSDNTHTYIKTFNSDINIVELCPIMD